MAYNIRRLKPISFVDDHPFQVLPYVGSKPPPTSTDAYIMVSFGECFTGFNYKDKITIDKLEEPILFDNGYAVYIEFEISTGLQVTKATIKSTLVGPQDGEDDTLPPEDTDTWYDFPNLSLIFPRNTYDEDGNLIELANGRRQYKAYWLLAISEIYDENRREPRIKKYLKSVSSLNGEKTIQYYQVGKTNLLINHGVDNGVFVALPTPFEIKNFLDVSTYNEDFKNGETS